MCIIMFKKEGKTIPESHFNESRIMNPDGFGYSYVAEKNGEQYIVTQKFLDFNKFNKSYRKDEQRFLNDTPFLIHFRACSKGKVTLQNAHPFVINDGQVFAHNGTIWGIPEDDQKKKSDTFMFNQEILRNLPFGWEKNKGIQLLVKATLGERNKVVVLNKNKEFIIFNEAKGLWDDNVWYSNEHYKGIFTRDEKGWPILMSELIKKRQEQSYNNWGGYSWRNDEWWEENEDNNYVPPEKRGTKSAAESAKAFTGDSIPFDDACADCDDLDDDNCCDFCGMQMDIKKNILNKEFDDLHMVCNYCAYTLTQFVEGVEYAN